MFDSSCWTLKWEKHSLEVKKSIVCQKITTSYCCVRYFHKRKNDTLYLPWISPLSFSYAKGVYSVKLSGKVPY